MMTQITDILAHLRMNMMTDMFINDMFIIMHFLVQNIIKIVRVVDKGFVYTAKSIPRLLTTEVQWAKASAAVVLTPWF